VDLFEFVTVVISMILALALGQLLSGAAALVKNRARVSGFLAHSCWLAFLFFLAISLWWSQWDFRDTQWTFPLFCYVLLGPTMLYFVVVLLVPDDPGGRQVDLELHFFSIRPVFFLLALGFVLVTWADGPLLRGQPVLGSVGLVNLFSSTLILGGLITKNRRYHVLTSVALCATFPVMMLIRFMPGIGG
jgi:hypothetical protein